MGFLLLSLRKFLCQLQLIGKIGFCEIVILGTWQYTQTQKLFREKLSLVLISKELHSPPSPQELEKQLYKNFSEMFLLKMFAIVPLLQKETFSLSCSSLAIARDVSNHLDRR